MRRLFKERKLFKGGNYMRKYGIFYFSMLKNSIWGFFFIFVRLLLGRVSSLRFKSTQISWRRNQGSWEILRDLGFWQVSSRSWSYWIHQNWAYEEIRNISQTKKRIHNITEWSSDPKTFRGLRRKRSRGRIANFHHIDKRNMLKGSIDVRYHQLCFPFKMCCQHLCIHAN